MLDTEKHLLSERKKRISKIYDGYIFQLYAQYYCLVEMGYTVTTLRFHSLTDNKVYPIPLPDEDAEMRGKFFGLLDDMRQFKLENMTEQNPAKCQKCIYNPLCDLYSC